MGFFHRLLGRPQVNLTPGYDQAREEEELRELADQLGYSWPRDKSKVIRVARLLDDGVSFDLLKSFTSPGGNETLRKVASFDSFPSFDQVVNRVESRHGGGEYHLTASGTTLPLLKTFILEGESKAPATATRKSGASNLSNLIESGLVERLEQNPEKLEAAQDAMLDRFVAKLAGGNKERTPEPHEVVIETLRSYRELEEEFKSQDDSWKGMLADVAKEAISTLLPNADKLMKSKAQQQEQEQTEYKPEPRPVPQPKTLPAIERPAATTDQPAQPTAPATQPRAATPADSGRVTGVSRLRPAQPAQPGQPPSRTTQSAQTPDQPDAVSIGLPEIDWPTLLAGIDWADLESRVNGPPADFMQWCHLRYYEAQTDGEAEPFGILIELIHANPPDNVKALFDQAVDLLQKPWARSLVSIAGRADDLAIAQRIAERLGRSQEGHKWLAQAHVASRMIQARVAEVGQGDEEEAKDPGEEASPQTPEGDKPPEPQAAEDLMGSVARSPNNGSQAAEDLMGSVANRSSGNGNHGAEESVAGGRVMTRETIDPVDTNGNGDEDDESGEKLV